MITNGKIYTKVAINTTIQFLINEIANSIEVNMNEIFNFNIRKSNNQLSLARVLVVGIEIEIELHFNKFHLISVRINRLSE